MIKTIFCTILAGTAVLAVTSIAARAETKKIFVPVDESQILQLPSIPGAVVVGNPSIADVSIQGQQLFVHGRSFGQTNMIILDMQGEQIASFELVGTIAQDTQVSLFKGAVEEGVYSRRLTYSCAPTCESSLQTGDQKKYFEMVQAQMSTKMQLASGSATAEAAPPQPPQ